MPSLQMKRELSGLCYEHHIEMTFGQVVLQSSGERTQILAYTCPEPDCLVHYHASRGYFVTDQNGNGNKLEMTPNVHCPHDGGTVPTRQQICSPLKPGSKRSACTSSSPNKRGSGGNECAGDFTAPGIQPDSRFSRYTWLRN